MVTLCVLFVLFNRHVPRERRTYASENITFSLFKEQDMTQITKTYRNSYVSLYKLYNLLP